MRSPSDVNPSNHSVGRPLHPGARVFLAAVAVNPLAFKIGAGPATMTMSEFLMFLSAALLLWEMRRRLMSHTFAPPIAVALPFVGCALLSGLGAPDHAAAARELVKYVLYLVIGFWIPTYASEFRCWGREVRGALRVAAALTLVSGIARCFIAPDVALWLWGPSRTFQCNSLLLLALLLAVRGRGNRSWAPLDKALIGALLLVTGALFLHHDSSANARSDRAPEPVSQHVREGFAALSVLSQAPLFGVGPGAYQQRIDAFYQGMPKENSMANGTQIGFTVLLASLGVLGMAGYLLWQWRSLQRAMHREAPRNGLIAFLALLFVWGFFTPLLVSQTLLLMALGHGLIWQEGHSACASSD